MFDHCFGDAASRDLTARPALRYLFPAILPEAFRISPVPETTTGKPCPSFDR
jgi:hypothetical protein